MRFQLRVVSIILSMVLAFTSLDGTAFAAENTTENNELLSSEDIVTTAGETIEDSTGEGGNLSDPENGSESNMTVDETVEMSEEELEKVNEDQTEEEFMEHSC